MTRVTIKDVADLAGVSTATVSNALNRPHKLSRKTLTRVRTAIKESGYVSDETARLLRVGVGRAVGVLVYDTANPLYAQILTGIEDESAANDLFALVCNTNGRSGREEDYVRFLEAQRVRGLVILPAGEVPESALGAHERGTPLVLLGETTKASPFSTVSGDDTRGGKMATAHLLQTGRRRIAFVGGPLSVPQLRNRLAGARSALPEFNGQAELEVIELDAHTEQAGRRAARQLLARAPQDRPDAVQAGNDLIAAGILHELLLAPSIRVPDDIAVIGYDDLPLAETAAVPLTTVRHPAVLMGRMALDLLIREIDSRDEGPPRHLIYVPELVVRDSTLPWPVATDLRAAATEDA
ncbi:LacI family DNA-binding transcriptional regulator [Streptomyces aculeolatus]